MRRSYYSDTFTRFIVENENSILGEMVKYHEFSLEEQQRNSWISQIRILKEVLKELSEGFVLFEYSIPRMGKRVDVVIVVNGNIILLEFKVGEKEYSKYGIDQVLDYALDLKNFHEASHNRRIIPILVATEAKYKNNTLSPYEDFVYRPLKANLTNLAALIKEIISELPTDNIDYVQWESSRYMPTPTIIEAAQALYRNHSVKEISRSDSDTINLGKTSATICDIIDLSKKNDEKAICFITGVPGAGKTLAGLNIANERLKVDENEHAVFLSGNGPLVLVLQEALARNLVVEKKERGMKIKKSEALSRTKAFIQNIHHFRDDAIRDTNPPIEKVAIFDEAQRAWTLHQTKGFMKRKKGIEGFDQSEPDFLISVLDRHIDWSVIICLIGGGQEINTGEAGLPEWFKVLRNKYPHWKVYLSDQLTDFEYTRGENLLEGLDNNRVTIYKELHLSVSIRSFRSERVSDFVKSLLDGNLTKSSKIFNELKYKYPLVLTQNIHKAKQWLREHARGTERYGIIASSGAYRLKPYGIFVKNKIKPQNWFLNDRFDIRSSYYLEDVATEFDIQGLELDWTCVCWDADLRYRNSNWEYMNFKGTKWQNVNDDIRKLYLKNAYRVLLTRARQGMVIFIPKGDEIDPTRKPVIYDDTYNYLKSIGIPTI